MLRDIDNHVSWMECGNLNRRQMLKSVVMGAAAFAIAAPGKGLNGTAINHISYQSADYKKTRDFYIDLLGFQVSDEDDKQLYLWAGNALISAKNTPAAPAPVMDHFGFTVEPWDVDTVQAALKDRGLVGRMSRNDPHDPAGKSVFVRDPNGYNVQLCAKDLETKPAPAGSRSPLKAVGINHISYQCADYARTRDFYKDLLGVTVTKDDGKQAYLWFGDAFVVVRNAANGSSKPLIDHFAWTVADWNADRIAAELKRRGMDARPDAEGKSIMTKDLNGYSLQLCSKDLESRPGRMF